MAPAKKSAPPKADMVMDEMPRGFRCPRCGHTDWSPGSYYYEPSLSIITHTCWHETNGRKCGYKVSVKKKVPDLIWVAPSQNWLIYREEPRLPPDMDNQYSTVASVAVSDGWNSGSVDINVGGRISYDEDVAYGAPQYVKDKAESILNRAWKEIVGSRPNGHCWPVYHSMVQPNGMRRSEPAVPYDSKKKALDAGEKMFSSLSDEEKLRGDTVVVAETDDWKGPGQPFHMRFVHEFSCSNDPKLCPKASKSILSDFEKIRKQLGEERFAHVEKFLEYHPLYDLSDLYYDEDVWDFFLEWERRYYAKHRSDNHRKSKRRDGRKWRSGR